MFFSSSTIRMFTRLFALQVEAEEQEYRKSKAIANFTSKAGKSGIINRSYGQVSLPGSLKLAGDLIEWY